tara:strand:- start:221 stop:4423 length:4203 start_codon:yes stop_codon:yes gene_type:complete
MNKDLDERLVKNGEYVDALNIQVGHSEGSDVGAIENVLGNTVKSALGLTAATVLGSIRNGSTEKIYWFVKATGVNCIAEYDQANNTVSPVIVDKSNVLNFSSSHLITGINIIDNLLLWTDNNSQPKKINIDTFKAGSSNFATHTQVYGRDFILADVKVIKRGPKTAPSITMKSTRQSGTSTVGCGRNEALIPYNFFNKAIGNTVVMAMPGQPNWNQNDVVSLRTSKVNDKNFKDEFEVRLRYDGATLSGPGYGAFDGDFTVLTISNNITDDTYVWSGVLEEADPMFEFSFPRFAYRWKYADGEYSVFSPFSDPAFLPDTFEYASEKAHNVGMVNNLRKLTLGSFETPPAEVIEIDILYKDSQAPLVYVVETIDDGETSYEITSEIIGNVVDSIQLLRQWDNVPIKAKAQEISANRVLYGNYLQGYDTPTKPLITASTVATTHTSLGNPIQSVKASRSYQLGVVYSDVDGRESPVFTSDNATLSIEKKNSSSTNVVKAQLTSAAPSWATHFKYFVKDVSSEYYNLALDRFYNADDGNLWLSFPSAERNKLMDGDYLRLKKSHDSETPVDANGRYRVLAIENEVPRSIAFAREHYVSTLVTLNVQPFPASGVREFKFDGPTNASDPKFFSAIDSGTVIRFRSGANISAYYNVIEGGFTGDSTIRYRVKLDREIEVADNWLDSLVITNNFHIDIYKEVERRKKEYSGKFFVKIHRDATFESAIIYPMIINDPSYTQVYEGETNAQLVYDTSDPDRSEDFFAFSEDSNTDANTALSPPTNSSATFGVGYAAHSAGNNSGSLLANQDTGYKWFDSGLSAGNLIRFDGDTTGKFYTIQSVAASVTQKRKAVDNVVDENVIIYKVVTLTENVAGTFTTTQVSVYDKNTSFAAFLSENSVILSSPSPAVFETEPQEQIDLDIYYSATNAIPIANHSAEQTLGWFNCYSFGNGVESDRIRDDFNAPRLGKGVVVSAPIDEPYAQERLPTGLIFSGIYNSISSVNKLNQFTLAEDIVKNLNPSYGSIQKLHVRNSDAIVLCEDKILRLLTHKDALYNADGNVNVTSNRSVLGQAVPYAGEFGISKNPESFASYGFRSYFSDKSRGVMLRLSMDGLTEISSTGMSDFFVDNLRSASTVIGSFDDQTNCYNVTLNGKTASFKENVRGWPTLKSFLPESGLSLNNTYYTFKNGELYSHDNTSRNSFYGGVVAASSVTFILNDGPSNVKSFKALSYEGSSGWTAPSIETDKQSGRVMSFIERESLWYNYIKGLDTTWDNSSFTGSLDTKEFSVQGIGTAVGVTDNTGSLAIDIGATLNVSLQAGAGDVVYFKDISADRVVKIGACTAISGEIITCTHTVGQPTPAINSDFIFFAKNSEVNTSGLMGYYARTKMEITSTTTKELFAVNSEITVSS